MTKPNKRAIALLDEIRKGCENAIRKLKNEPLKTSEQLDEILEKNLTLVDFESGYDSIVKSLTNNQ